MKRHSLLTALSLLGGVLMSQSVSADILMKWERKPLPIALKPEQERIVFVDKNVKVGYPAELDGKLRIQSTGGAVYFKALSEFPTTRLQLRDVATGELILLDVSASTTVQNPQEPIRFVYETQVQKQSAAFAAQDDAALTQLGLADGASIAKPQLPVPAALTRYAAQSLYAPLRTIEPLDGVRQVAHRLPAQITTLLPQYPVRAVPLISWQLGDYIVTAIRLQNRGQSRIQLDPRELQGRFYAATFQHAWLGGYGSPEDTTTVYLVTEGYANHAVIPETKRYKPRPKVKKVTVTKTTVINQTPPKELSNENQ